MLLDSQYPVDSHVVKGDPIPTRHVMQVEMITPERARYLLSLNTRNRPISQHALKKKMKDLVNGRFQLNMQPILISDDSTLLDGQHRLEACVKTGKSFMALMVYNCEPRTFETLDTGRKRTPGDTLAVERVSHYTQIAGALNLLATYYNGAGRLNFASSLANYEIMEMYERHKEIQRSVSATRRCLKIISPSYAIALHYLFAQKNQEKADLFFTQLADGIGLGKLDPVYHLRERLRDAQVQRKRLQYEDVGALAIKAWNSFIKNEPMRLLRYNSDNETYPTIKG